MFKKRKTAFPTFRQLDKMDCGPACVKIISEHYGKRIDFKKIKENSYLTKQGVSLSGIIACADKFNMDTLPVKMNFSELKDKASLPAIVHWQNNHFMVIYKIEGELVHLSDPRYGLRELSIKDFKKGWLDNSSEGSVLLIEPTNAFFNLEDSEKTSKENIGFLKNYFKPYQRLILQVFLGIIITSFIQLCLPFLMQSLVDFGISNHDISFVYIIAVAQVFLFLALAAIRTIQSWILLHITTRINIKLISDFLTKLFKLPIAYFQTKQRGDLLQRIYDHDRIEEFLSSNTLNALFGVINIIMFGFVLAYFNMYIFIVFLIGSLFYLLWTFIFMRKRAEIDFEEFEGNSKNQSSLIQILSSITEIKLNGSEQRRKNEWKSVQYSLFDISLRGLGLAQKQVQGGQIINQLKNILIILLAAKFVIDGDISLGTMLAIQFVIGQINAPLNDIIGFMFTLQDANISIKRLSEIHNAVDEEILTEEKPNRLEENYSIDLKNLSFRYGPPDTKLILDNINLTIPKNKVTAIVGPSGSGKTTLMKLLLNFYKPISGEVLINNKKIETYNLRHIRANCGVVMQDGYIFNDSLLNNITESNSTKALDEKLLNKAIDIAQLNDLIKSLPNELESILGANGSVLSGGERQRILIARAIYKNPKYLFFDEATSSLDSSNEKKINEALSTFFQDKTVLVIAHRLSTVKNADQIVVLDSGKIQEIGGHDELIALKGKYFELVKNQL